MIKQSFAPVAADNTRVLVLGSLPGEVSLSRGQYYAHPQNQFWRLMQAVTGAELPLLAYPERLAALLAARVGLWDVIGAARRQGSLDAAIRDHEANPLADLAARLPNLRALAFNGGKAFEIGRRQLGAGCRFELIALPSSSPAHTLAFERKRAEWMRLKPFLDVGG